MTLALESTLIDPYYPLRRRGISELRGYPPVLGENPSSESASELPGNSSEDSSELPGNSSETIESLIQDLELQADFVIEVEDAPPKTLAEAARILGLKGGTQSATSRLTRLSTRFPMNLLKDGKQLTVLGWELMQALSTQSVDELWEEYQSAIVIEPEPEPKTVDVEIIDESEVGAAIVLRTQAILANIQEVDPPTIVLGQHFDNLVAHYQAAGEQMGQQLGAVFQTGVAQGFQSVVTQGTIGGLQ